MIARGGALQKLKRILKKIGSKNGVRLMFLLGYLLAFGIPFAYAYLAKPPAESDMRVSEGTAHFQYRIKRGYMLMVDGHDYTCGGQYLNANPDCFNDGRTRHVHLEGRRSRSSGSHKLPRCLGRSGEWRTYCTKESVNFRRDT